MTQNPLQILIVDDDRGVQRLLSEALTKQGYSTMVERDGDWALRTFQKKHFDVVILDLLLPAMNGYEVAKKIRATPRGQQTPIIMISGVYKTSTHQREAIEKHGAFAFLEKPIKLAALYDVLRAALKGRTPKGEGTSSLTGQAKDEAVTEERLADSEARQEAGLVENHALRSSSGFQVLRGDFGTSPFPQVLGEIHQWKATGALLMKRDTVKKIVFFREGHPQSVKSNVLGECLGRLMVHEKIISEAECEESLRRMKSSGRQQGTVLIEMGCISPHNLVYALNVQLQTKLFEIFSWTRGDFQFNAKVEAPPDTVRLEMTTAAILCEGVRRAFGAERLKAVFGYADGLYVHAAESPLLALQDAGLGEDEQQLLAAVDGRKTVATLRAMAILPPLDTLRLLYAMRCARMIELRNEPLEGRPTLSLLKPAESLPQPPPLPPSPPERTEPPTVPALGARHEAPRPEAAPRPFDARAVAPVSKRVGESLLPELSENNADEGFVRERLAMRMAQLNKMTYFEILEIGPEASREEIKRSYFALAKSYHPDRHFGSSSAEVRQLAGQIYDLISKAHDVLTDPSEKERYLQELQAGVSQRETRDEVSRILAAEGKFQRGEELLRQRKVKAAHQLFREAIDLYSEEGEFHAYFGWSLFQLSPNDPEVIDVALRALERAVSLNPKAEKSYLFTGYIYKASGRPDKAEKQFEKAIQCNPDCTEALRELRVLGQTKR